MPLTNYACPDCGGCLHTDDLLEGECITPGCGETFPAGLGTRDDLPEFDIDDWEAEHEVKVEHEVKDFE